MTRLWLSLCLVAGADGGLRIAAVPAQTQPSGRDAGERRAAAPQEQPPSRADAGLALHQRLSAEDCEALVEVLILISVNDSLKQSAEYRALKPEERLATKKEVQRRALADSRLGPLRRDCPVRYSRRQADCIHLAKSMDEVDACPR